MTDNDFAVFPAKINLSIDATAFSDWQTRELVRESINNGIKKVIDNEFSEDIKIRISQCLDNHLSENNLSNVLKNELSTYLKNNMNEIFKKLELKTIETALNTQKVIHETTLKILDDKKTNLVSNRMNSGNIKNINFRFLKIPLNAYFGTIEEKVVSFFNNKYVHEEDINLFIGKAHLLKCNLITNNIYCDKLIDIINQEPKNGKPDIIVECGDEFFFIEVKSENDSIRLDQIEWAIKHPSFIVEYWFIIDTSKEVR